VTFYIEGFIPKLVPGEGLLKFGTGVRASSIPMFLAPCQPGNELVRKGKI
jgi:hypothetical protein